MKKLTAGRVVILLTGLFVLHAATSGPAPTAASGQTVEAYRERMQRDLTGTSSADTGNAATVTRQTRTAPTIRPVGGGSNTAREALLTEPDVLVPPSPNEILEQIPDPSYAAQNFASRLAALKQTAREDRIVTQYERVIKKALEYLTHLDRDVQRSLTLEECLQIALQNNYGIRIEAENPAISAAQLVEAEAAFDASFFLEGSWTNNDQPTAVELAANQSDTRNYRTGIRQLLPSGMQAEVSFGQIRSETDLAFATLNPSYTANFRATLSQPLLRGFGLDVNRAQIHLRQTDLRISRRAFERRVRETLLAVEQAYWSLVQARRTTAIVAGSVAQTFETYNSMKQRLDHDATPVEVANSESRWRTREVEFIETLRLVQDAEEALKNVLNDPELLHSDNVELIPVETPFAAAVAIDHFGEVRAALDHRAEIAEARERIESARIQTGVAKNSTLPQLDLTFNYDVAGLGTNFDQGFDDMTRHRFRSYTVGIAFSMPIGNRGPRAAYQRARRQERQTVLALQQTMDSVVVEVNNEIRRIMFRYRQLPPSLVAVRAASRNLRALQARTQRINPSFLETELANIEQLANARRQLLQVLIDYNIGLVQLENAKGTLLEYNNVVLDDGLGG